MRTKIIQDEPHGGTASTPDHVGPPTRRRSAVSRWMCQHRLVSFFALAIALSWWAWPLRAAGISEQPGFVPAGPLLAALIVISVTDGVAGLRELGSRLLRWRVGWRWYAAAVGLPLVVIVSISLVNVTLFDARMTPVSDLAWSSFALLFAVRLVNPMDGPMGEEPAWRGYAVPQLQARRSPLRSAVILGLLVTLWHLPIVVMESGSYFYLANSFAITLVYVWLFNRTGGSVLLTLLMHVTQGTFTIANLGFDAEGARRMAWLGFVGWSIVAAAVVVLDREAWRAAPAAARPADRDPTATAGASRSR
jgi:membrane protease YdiL (CAAX protease family)